MLPILTNTYFSGAGLMDIGIESGGLTLQQSFEIDALCCDTMRRNFSHEVVQCDITKKLVQSERNAKAWLPINRSTSNSRTANIPVVPTGNDLFLHFFRLFAFEGPG